MPNLNLNADNLIINLTTDDYKIIVKQPQFPVITTGNTYWNFTGSGCTVVTENPHGNIVDVTVYSPCYTGVTLQQFTSYTGATEIRLDTLEACCTGNTASLLDLWDYTTGFTAYYIPIITGNTADIAQLQNNLTGLTSSFDSHTGDTSIHFVMSAITINQSQVIDLVDDIDYIGALITGMTVDIQTNYECCTGNTADIDYHYSQFTGLTLYISDIIVPAITGNTQDISDLNDNFTAHTSQVGTGSIHFTGHTFTASGIAVVSQSGDSVNYYVPADSITGVTFAMITGDVSGNTNLQNALDLKLDNSVYQGDMLIIGGEIDNLTSGLTAHTGDTTIHYAQSAITITESQISDLQDYALQADFTGHTGDTSIHYVQSAITITESQISDLQDYALESDLTGHTSDLTIHYQQSAITITESQVTNLVSDLAGKSDTGHTHAYSAITNTPDLSVYQPVSGMSAYTLTGTTQALSDAFDSHTGNTVIHFSGHTFQGSGITQVSLNGDLVTIYTPADTLTGVTWGMITGTLSGQTDLQDALDLKLDNSVYQGDMLIIAGEIDDLITGVTANTASINALDLAFNSHTGDTTIHYAQSAITITESQISDLQDYALQADFTGHTGDTSIHYEMSAITITESQISDLQAYTLTGTTQALSDAFDSHTGDTNIHYAQSAITITESQISDLQDYALQTDFTGHTSDLTIHYAQSAITITESQISDLQAYTLTGTTQALSDAFDSHTGDTTIHFVQSGITITESQVTNLPTDLSYLQTQIDNLSALQTNDKLYIFENTSSDIPTYETLSPVPTQDSETTETVNLTLAGGETLIDAYITPPLYVTGITAGIWTGHFHAYVNSTLAGRQTNMRFKGYRYDAETSGETLLFTTADFLINTLTVKEYQASMALPTYTGFTALDRLVIKVYGQSNNTTTLNWVYNSVDTTAFIEVPITIATAPLWNNIVGIPTWLDYTTIGDFQTGHTHSYNNLTDLPSLFSGDYDDLTNKPDLSVYQPVSGMSIYLTGVTWNDVTNKPDLTLQADFTGHTSDTSIHYVQSAITITESQISDLKPYITGFTVTCDMVTGCTDGLYLPITGLTGYWTSAQTTGYVTGLNYITGYTVTADDVTGITASLYAPIIHTHEYSAITNTPDLSVYQPVSGMSLYQPVSGMSVYLTGVTWNIITGDISGNTTLQNALNLKLDNSVYQGDMLIITGEIDNVSSGLTAHTGDTTIHFTMDVVNVAISAATSGLTADWNSLLNRPDWLTGTTLNDFQLAHTHSQYLTGYTLQCSAVTACTNGLYAAAVHTHAYSAITDTPDLNAYALSGHTHSQYLTGYTLQCSGVTACTDGLYAPIVHTHEYSAITNTPDLSLYQPVSGMSIYLTGFTVTADMVTGITDGLYAPINHTHSYTGLTDLPTLFTGNTFVESGITQISQVGDVVTIYTPAGGVTIVGSGNTTATSSGSTWIIYSPTGDTGSGTLTATTVTYTGGTNNLVLPSGVTYMEYLIVAAGGGAGSAEGGGSYYPGYGGGGGAGQMIEGIIYSPLAATYTCIVGAGGSGAAVEGTAANGNNSSITGTSLYVIALGGGYGGTMKNGLNAGGANGGCGGGGTYINHAYGAGGAALDSFYSFKGGAGGAGTGTSYKGGCGGGVNGNGGYDTNVGRGKISTISGGAVTYGTGGSIKSTAGNGANATANTGNGGQAGCSGAAGSNGTGGNGGSGVIIIRYWKY